MFSETGTRISICPKTFCFYKEESVKGNSDKLAHKIYKEAVLETQKNKLVAQNKIFGPLKFLF